MKFKWLLITALLTQTAFANVGLEEKKNRIQYLEELSTKAVSMNIEAYRRELEYEKLDIPLEKRAQNEANLLAEKVKDQVQKSYELALTKKSPEEAAAEIREAIERDIILVAPELQDEIKDIAISALESVHLGGFSADTKLERVEKVLLKGVQDRHQFFNEPGDDDFRQDVFPAPMVPTTRGTRDAEIKEFLTKGQIIESLVSDRESARWVSTSNMTIKSDAYTRVESKISLQIKVEFLGVALEAGPLITFKREYKTSANIMAEGLNPVLLSDGNFDYIKRDQYGRPVKRNNVIQSRLLNFNCDASLDFETEYAGSGGFSVAGVGASSTIARKYSNSVSLSSRRILVPEYIDDKSVTLKFLRDLCHMDFLRAKVTNTMNVSDSLNVMMKNIVSSLRFSHPKTKCAQDNHCYNWYNKEIIPLARAGNFPRCVEETREKYRACELRGLKNQNCSVFDATGKRISDGMFEFTCDAGLKCVKYQEAGWFRGFDIYQYAKGKCMPINARTYRSPLEKPKKDYIEVYLAD